MVTEYIEKAWKVYRKNFGQIAIAILLQFLISGTIMLIGIAPWILMIFFSSASNFSSMILSYLGLIIFSIIFIAISVVISIVLNGGFTRMLYDSTRGKTNYQTMFKVAKEKCWTILGANSIFLLITLLIIFIIFVPLALLMGFSSMIPSEGTSMIFLIIIFLVIILGIIAMAIISALFVFVNEAIVIDNLKAFDAVKKSIEVSRKCYLKILGLMFIFMLINSALDTLFSFVGSFIEWFVTMPILFICYIYLYLENRKK